MENEAEFEYLRQVAKKYGGLCLVEIDAFINHITEEQLRELFEAYEEIERKGDAHPLSLWIDECFSAENDARRILPRLLEKQGGLTPFRTASETMPPVTQFL